MFKLFSARFWDALASIILRNRLAILLLIGLCTLLMTTQWSKMRFTYTEANLLPDDHPVNLKYNDFLEIFGEEGNLIVLGVKDSLLFSVENLNAWNRLSKSFENNPYVETVVTLQDLKKLVKNNKLIVDGSHNEDGARALNEYLQSLDCNKHIIIGMMANKEHEKYISYFKDISSITTIDLKTQTNAISGKDLKEKFKNIKNVQYQPNIEQAIKSINCNEGDLLLITGSLYGAAEVLSLN